MAWSTIYQNDKSTAFKGSIVLIVLIVVIVIVSLVNNKFNRNKNLNSYVYTLGTIQNINYTLDKSIIELAFSPASKEIIDTVFVTTFTVKNDHVFVRYLHDSPKIFTVLFDTIPLTTLKPKTYWTRLDSTMYVIRNF